jgi:glycerol-3-phosphate dehydrogenase (NAD(P)+)
MMAASIGIAGAGAWGTALANVIAAAGRPVVLWTRDPAQAEALRDTRENRRFLPTRAMAGALAPVLRPGTPLVLCAKGLEQGSNLFLTDVVRSVRGDAPLAVLSGPSFADDVALGLPTAVTLASSDGARARALAEAVSGPTFRVYHGTDPRGVEIGGAAKNVLAIACGAVVGRGLGESAKAALMARGFAELLRFAESYGAERETLMGLSGLGDLVLTASSAQSRNFAFGERLGRGVPVAEAAGGKLAEGALTAPVLVAMAAERGIEMPIASAVAAVIAGRLTLPQAIDALMQRPLKREH